MANYNPFGKSINELEKDDLEKLIKQKIVEGFYVEYKREFVKPEKIAQSIASFANTYGGWYFIGVVSDKTDNSAESLCGFDHTIYTDPTPQVLNPVRDHLSHMPLLFYKIVKISETHSVFAIHVPEGVETPYIHKNGRIYRRAADASDPIHESNRYSVDRLVDRGRKEVENFLEFCQDNRTFSKVENEEELAWLNLYFRPQPFGLIEDFTINSPDNLKKSLKNSQNQLSLIEEVGITGSSPFNLAYSAGESAILRYSETDKIAFNSKTMQFFPDGSCKIHLPVFCFTSTDIEALEISNQRVNEKLSELTPQFSDNSYLLKFANLGECAWTATSCIRFYLDWLISLGWISSLWGRIELSKGWRLVPVINSDYWVELVEELGLPVCPYSKVSIPSDTSGYLIHDYEDRNKIARGYLMSIVECFGISPYGEPSKMLIDHLVYRTNNKIPD